MASARRSRKLPIFVRFNSNTNIPIQADPQWNVSKLKEEIGKQQAVDPKDIRIIFAGRELRDDMKLKVLLILSQINFHNLFSFPFIPCGVTVLCISVKWFSIFLSRVCVHKSRLIVLSNEKTTTTTTTCLSNR